MHLQFAAAFTAAMEQYKRSRLKQNPMDATFDIEDSRIDKEIKDTIDAYTREREEAKAEKSEESGPWIFPNYLWHEKERIERRIYM